MTSHMKLPLYIPEDTVTKYGKTAAKMLAAIRQNILFDLYFSSNDSMTVTANKCRLESWMEVSRSSVKRALTDLCASGVVRKEVVYDSHERLQLSLSAELTKELQEGHRNCVDLFDTVKKDMIKLAYKLLKADKKIWTPVFEKRPKFGPQFSKNGQNLDPSFSKSADFWTPVSFLNSAKDWVNSVPKEIQLCLTAGSYDLPEIEYTNLGTLPAILLKYYTVILLVYNKCNCGIDSSNSPLPPFLTNGGFCVSLLANDRQMDPQADLAEIHRTHKSRLKAGSAVRQVKLRSIDHPDLAGHSNEGSVESTPKFNALYPYLYAKHTGVVKGPSKPPVLSRMVDGVSEPLPLADVVKSICLHMSEVLLEWFPTMQFPQSKIIMALHRLSDDYVQSSLAAHGLSAAVGHSKKFYNFMQKRYQLVVTTNTPQYDPIDLYVYDIMYAQIHSIFDEHGLIIHRDLFDWSREFRYSKIVGSLFLLSHTKTLSIKRYIQWCIAQNRKNLQDVFDNKTIRAYIAQHGKEQCSL